MDWETARCEQNSFFFFFSASRISFFHFFSASRDLLIYLVRVEFFFSVSFYSASKILKCFLIFSPKMAPSLGSRLKDNLDGIDEIIMELGKCVVEKQSEVVTTSSVGLWTTTPGVVDIEDIFGVVGSDVQQQPSTLSPRTLTPLGGGLQHANSTSSSLPLSSQSSTEQAVPDCQEPLRTVRD